MLLNGEPIDELNVVPVASPPDAPSGSHILAAFDFTPSGATFESGVEITIVYNKSTVAAGDTVAIAFYNVSASAWQYITPPASTTDLGGDMAAATFTVTHFTVYGPLTVPAPPPGPYQGPFYYIAPPPGPTTAAQPSLTPITTPISSPITTPASSPAASPGLSPTASPVTTISPAPTSAPEEEEGMKAPTFEPTNTPAAPAALNAHSDTDEGTDWIRIVLIIVWSIVALLGLGLILKVIIQRLK